ncbi:hypothetical protein, partial [Escherichia coli]|uniref:hypothetical protein n=2 Tax=Pseudomonadota TaxID=1224 RepID=UPI00225C06EE
AWQGHDGETATNTFSSSPTPTPASRVTVAAEALTVLLFTILPAQREIMRVIDQEQLVSRSHLVEVSVASRGRAVWIWN